MQPIPRMTKTFVNRTTLTVNQKSQEPLEVKHLSEARRQALVTETREQLESEDKQREGKGHQYVIRALQSSAMSIESDAETRENADQSPAHRYASDRYRDRGKNMIMDSVQKLVRPS